MKIPKGKLNILFTSVGRRSYLVKYFMEALGNRGEVFVANSTEITPAFQIADHSVITPLIYDENYIPFLLEYCKENNINAIIPLFDVDLPMLAGNKENFLKIGVQVIVSEPEVIDICNDKWRTYQFLKHRELKTPLTYINIDNTIEAIKEGKAKYPLMIKPRWGMGSIAVYEADNEIELRILYEKSMRQIKETYLKYESSKSVKEAVLIQEKIIGQEYGLDIINDLNGNYQNTICKLKYAIRAGETDCAVTVENEIIYEVGTKLSGMLRHAGNLDVDVIMVGDVPYILDMNARFGGGYPFSHIAGVNLPEAMINWLLGENANPALLKSRVNIMSQKDISLVRVYPRL